MTPPRDRRRGSFNEEEVPDLAVGSPASRGRASEDEAKFTSPFSHSAPGLPSEPDELDFERPRTFKGFRWTDHDVPVFVKCNLCEKPHTADRCPQLTKPTTSRRLRLSKKGKEKVPSDDEVGGTRFEIPEKNKLQLVH